MVVGLETPDVVWRRLVNLGTQIAQLTPELATDSDARDGRRVDPAQRIGSHLSGAVRFGSVGLGC